MHRFRARKLRYPATALALFWAVSSLAQPATGPASDNLGFDVDLTFSPKAAAKIQASREQITVEASWFGDPTKAAANQVDEVGRIDLGREKLGLIGKPGIAHVSGLKVDRKRLSLLSGPVSLNVNIYSARRSGPDNIFACDFFDGELTHAQLAPIALNCSLIEENVPTQAKS